MTDNTNAGRPAASIDVSTGIPELLAIIAQRVPDSVPHAGGLLYPCGLVLTIDTGSMQTVAGAWTAQVLFIAQHDWFDEAMVISIAGTGRSADEALQNAANQYASAYLPAILKAFDGGRQSIEADIPGNVHRFAIPDSRPVLHTGEGDPVELWRLIAAEMPHYIGTKRAYWIEMTASAVNGRADAEVRVNGAVCHRLSDILFEDLTKRSAGAAGYCSDKQLVMLLQHADTVTECPYDKQRVGDLTFRAFRLMQNIRDEKTMRATQRDILALTAVRPLAEELLAFLPEITAQLVVQYRDNDGLIAMPEHGAHFRLNRTQVRSYGYIEDALIQYLRKQQPERREINQVLAASAKFHAVAEAMKKGVKLEDFRVSELAYKVGEDYLVY